MTPKTAHLDVSPIPVDTLTAVVATDSHQEVGDVADGWSGWATQYPGKLPKLFGAREIAELNYYPEEGARLIRLVEAGAAPPAELLGAGGRYWRERAGFWREKAVELGWREVLASTNGERADPTQPASGDGARVLTCVYCGQEYPQGTAAWGESVLTEHIGACQKHPMRSVLADNTRLRAALVGIVGESDPGALRKMATLIATLRGDDADKAATINAINALLGAP